MFTALNISNNILKRGFDEKIKITPMKLQKMLYLVYKKYYQDCGVPLFSDPVEVWKYGPVVRSVYDEFRDFKSKPIKRYAQEEHGTALMGSESSPQLKRAVDYVWNNFKTYNGIQLSSMTRKKGSAWYKAATTGQECLLSDDIKEEAALV